MNNTIRAIALPMLAIGTRVLGAITVMTLTAGVWVPALIGALS